MCKVLCATKFLAQVIDFLEHEISLKGEAEDERKALLQAGRLNLAMCHLKMSQWIEARGVCDKVENWLMSAIETGGHVVDF